METRVAWTINELIEAPNAIDMVAFTVRRSSAQTI